MRVAYFDCFSGASGNMIVGALVDAGLDQDLLISELAKLDLEGYELRFSKRVKHAIQATHLEVWVEGENPPADHDHSHPQGASHGHTEHHDSNETHSHGPTHTHADGHHTAGRHLADILELVATSGLSERVKQQATQVFDALASAEAKVHGKRKEEVHLHEVSGIDSIVDIVGTVTALELLDIGEVVVSPIALGTGFVRCEHGRMPLPAPGTIELLRGIPVQPTNIRKELTTPTGAALLSTLATSFGPMPEMTVESIGYGAGTRDLEDRPNLLRVCIEKKNAPWQTGFWSSRLISMMCLLRCWVTRRNGCLPSALWMCS